MTNSSGIIVVARSVSTRIQCNELLTHFRFVYIYVSSVYLLILQGSQRHYTERSGYGKRRTESNM